MPHQRPSLLPFPIALLAVAQLLASPAQAQQPASNERVTQQLREAIERSNAQRAVPAGRKGDAPAPVPSVTLSIGGADGSRVMPTPPTAPTAAAPRAAQAAAKAGAAPAATPASAPAQALRPARIVLPERPAAAAPASAEAPADEVPATAVRPLPARAAERYSDEQVRRQYERARAIANGLPIPASARLPREAAVPEPRDKPDAPRPPVAWSYAGEGGPAAWARLRPEYQLCGSGQRQSPIHIEASAVLQGPNEALGLDYGTGGGTVLHDGRTIRVEVDGNHLLQVRGSSYRLVHFDFHHPAEPVVNHEAFAMSVHLVHRDAQGRTAIVAVLLQPGAASPFIDKVWTYIPLDVGDRVAMPAGWLDIAALLPQDQRYYQYFGSMSTPPCEEGVLWMVLKQPVTLSAEQLQLFARLFPSNARPVQALNGRIVRDAQ
ncbi:carbonic anhydrase [Pseudorhodoferax sp. Leaf267]|uniref:carbonic anhydrase n=1 Tax=Pseudorhodoferax sp. Leaf267 TaxID=1736316 RepID=UPI0006F6420B|nr:carbonic anhydrase family protein [Pseudorhodoferax sp. Leaf267]KQP21780.1 hypothetical protein ASF43_26130 [Pseudorhodoferax sp. Leaf267]